MKLRIALFMGLLFAVSGVALMGVSIAAYNFDFVALQNNDVTYHSQTFTQTSNLTIHANSSNYELIPHDKDEYIVEYYEYPGYTFSYSEANDELSLSHHYNFFDDWYREPFKIRIGLKMKVYFPQSVENLKVSGLSGKITATNYEFNDVDISISSGAIYLANIKTQQLSLKANSGNITIVDIEALNANISYDSGYVKATRLTCDALNVRGDSGYIKVVDSHITNSVNISVKSGYVSYENKSYADATIKLTSGSLYAYLHGKYEDYNVSIKVKSGTCNIHSNNHHAGNHQLDVSLTSGFSKIYFRP